MNNPNVKGEFYNVVIPVKKNKDHGYCQDLLDIFEMTPVISWELQQISSGGGNFVYNIADYGDLIKDKKQIELIRGEPLAYMHSNFAKFEMILNRILPSTIHV